MNEISSKHCYQEKAAFSRFVFADPSAFAFQGTRLTAGETSGKIEIDNAHEDHELSWSTSEGSIALYPRAGTRGGGVVVIWRGVIPTVAIDKGQNNTMQHYHDPRSSTSSSHRSTSPQSTTHVFSTASTWITMVVWLSVQLGTKLTPTRHAIPWPHTCTCTTRTTRTFSSLSRTQPRRSSRLKTFTYRRTCSPSIPKTKMMSCLTNTPPLASSAQHKLNRSPRGATLDSMNSCEEDPGKDPRALQA
jgi:hypothetical protein